MDRNKLISVTAKDCDFEYFRGSGNGGQKKQKTSSACRCTHKASGAVGRAEDHREQSRNKQLAFKRMAETTIFRKWLTIECLRANGIMAQIEQQVEESMKHVIAEGKDEEGRWTKIE